MARIFGVSHIFLTFFTSLKVSEIAAKYEEQGNSGDIVQGKHAISIN